MAKSKTVFRNVRVVSDGKAKLTDVKVVDEHIELIAPDIRLDGSEAVIEGEGNYLLPGMIDDQVHFREPGLTQKGNIYTESRAAVAGGITSFMEMPNVSPATTTIDALEAKFEIAAKNSVGNYSFYLGATEDNLEQIKKLDPTQHCGIKVFMGASTGDLLVEAPHALDDIFREAPTLIVTHCESSPVIGENLARLESQGITPTIHHHPIIRDVEACYASSSYAVGLAKQFGTQLHVLHLTTEKELSLFSKGPIAGKQITAEACVHHLWFTDQDYEQLGNLIKCNPSIKAPTHREALIAGVNSDIIDIIATDHAPHTWAEKQRSFMDAPAGLPLVQHALLSLIDQVKLGRMTIEKVVEKVCHNPAIRYNIPQRGFIKEGYFADLVLLKERKTVPVSHDNTLYKCGWSPFHGHSFSSGIAGTWVNGNRVFDGSKVIDTGIAGKRLRFDR